MKRPTTSCCVPEEPYRLRPEVDATFASWASGENITDTFDFALEWPTCQVLCNTPSEGREEDTLLGVLSSTGDSSTTNKEIGESTRVFHTLVQRKQAHAVRKVATVDHAYLQKGVSTKVSTNHIHGNRLPLTDDIVDVYPHSISINGPIGSNAPQGCPGNKRRFVGVCSASDERRKIQRRTYLPPEIVEMVISHVAVAEPRCALNLVVPDWGICPRESPEPQAPLRISRFVTYVRGIGVRVGALSYKYEHGDNDHILAPVRDFDPSVVALNVTFYSEYTRDYYRNHTHVFTLGATDLPTGAVGQMLGDAQPLRNLKLKTILPFDDEPIELAKRSAGLTPNPIYQSLRHIAVHSPLELMQVDAESLPMEGDAGSQVSPEILNNALDLDRSAHLWLSWSRMPKLESVFLDLRIYSHDLNTRQRCLSKFQVMERAREMGRHLQLKILVLAGLQSYSFQVAYEGLAVRDVEQWQEIDGEPNWIKIFRPAVRGGGKIILVDKLFDDLSDWAHGLARASRGGLVRLGEKKKDP
ncbi:hypothetical protein O1611_g8312 [Lasiodiplodia mahajangana]|uniref:Uncharacterized protein n=1 Tax=Lasiodiplodia mahajangana TaxID=1108764 RepID=A0ACC2JD78_9PEZI|nr:hypothetical protein O1611_g8312 [Lasiodiplodia mahajangana]